MKNLILLEEQRQSINRSSDIGSDDVFNCCDLAHYNQGEGHYDDDDDDDEGQAKLHILLPCGKLLFIHDDSSSYKSCNLNEDFDNDSTWFQATSVEEIESIVAISHSGKIVTVTETAAGPTIVGVFEQGILNASWSPDGQVLLIITTSPINRNELVLVTMNTAFDILAEATLLSDNNDNETVTSEPVSIAWKPPIGTTFAISSVDKTNDFTPTIIRKIRIYKREDLSFQSIGLSEDGSGRTVYNITSCPISWAGSGCSFLLAAIQQTATSLLSKVIFFEPNGLRHKEFTLQNNDKNNRQQVVDNLIWNNDSDLLAVSYSDTTTTTSTTDSDSNSRVQLYHRSNYHWYLKYEFNYTAMKVTHLKFDSIQPLSLSVCLANTGDEQQQIEWRLYDFCWDTNSSLSKEAIVIDGSSLLITPLQIAIVPPPMFAYKMTFTIAPVVQVAFTTHPTSSAVVSMITQLSNGTLCLLGTTTANNDYMDEEECFVANYKNRPRLLATVTTICDQTHKNEYGSYHYDSTRLRQYIIVGEKHDMLYLISVECSANSPECLVVLQIDLSTTTTTTTTTNITASIIHRLPVLDGLNNHNNNDDDDGGGGRQHCCRRVLRIVNMTAASSELQAQESDEERVLVHLTDGSLLECTMRLPSANNNNSSSITALLDCCPCEPMMEPCPWISALSIHATTTSGKHPFLIVGLSRRRRLYCGEQLLCSSASTFAFGHDFVIYVSSGSRAELHFIPIPSLASWDPLSGSECYQQQDYEPRQVERGSTIVTVLSEAPNVIIQLPRGNLEVVYPRALTLPFCFKLIHHKKYSQALDIMRRNKVDLNLLVDFDPCAFSQDIASFLLESYNNRNNVDQLNLFLAMLINEDITLHKYPIPEWFSSTLPHQQQKERFDFSRKVNTVCQRMRSAMVELEEDSNNIIQRGYFLLPILSSFAKETPPKLEDALELIRNSATNDAADATKQDNRSRTKSPFLSDKAQSSIQYLAFLADYELLFNTALGMYDYDLAKAVARNSQMDPKVYLPMLKRLVNSSNDAMARYEVDMKLGRYERALRNLAEVKNDDTSPKQEKSHLDQCLNLVEQHQLHKLGLQLFASNKRMYRDIMISLGERLFKEQKFATALTAFLAVEPKDVTGAKKAARMCNDWRSYFACCMEQQEPQQQTSENDDTAKVNVALVKQSIAMEVANELSQHTSSVHGADKRDALHGAARILLDYCQDVEGAVDLLISGQLWDEARRISLLYSKSELEQRCFDASEAYTDSCMRDFEERAMAFETANQQYKEVLKIIQEAKRTAINAGEVVEDDSGSIYSMASAMSATSLQSNMSRSSVGSITSISSVISAGAISTFSLSSHTDPIKHKSKHNLIGKGGKKKKERKQKNKMKRGSEEELKSIVSTLEQNCVFEDYRCSIVETIFFLSRTGKLYMARDLYEQYEDMRIRVDASQVKRISDCAAEIEERRTDAAKTDGHEAEVFFIGCDKKVDELRCCQLPQDLNLLFDFFARY